MGKTYKNTKIIVITAVAVLFSGTFALAGWGMGYGHHGWMHQGSGYGYRENLSPDEIKKLDEEGASFLKETENLRQQIYQKRLELASEMAKQSPDEARASALVKGISEMRAQFGQKRLDHLFRVRKISPNAGRMYFGSCPQGGGMRGGGMMGGSMMEPGMGRSMMGPGGGQGMMGGNMMGPGMGPGMMGYGGGRGMGPDWQDRGFSQPYRGARSPLKEKEARTVVENYLKSTRNPNLQLGKINDLGNAFEVEIVTRDTSLVDKVLVDKRSGWIRSVY